MEKKNPSNKNLEDLTDREFNILLKEIDIINTKIAKHDDHSLIIKGWTITLWSAFMVWTITQYLGNNFEILLYFPIIIPVSFWFIDALFKYFQRMPGSRSSEIEDYINYNAKLPKDTDYKFRLYDPVARMGKDNPFFKENYFPNWWKPILVRIVSIFYLILIDFTLIMIAFTTLNLFLLIPIIVVFGFAVLFWILSQKQIV